MYEGKTIKKRLPFLFFACPRCLEIVCFMCEMFFFSFFRFVGQHDVRTNAAATHFSRTQLTARQFGESAKLYESGDVATATYGHTLDLPPT